MTGSRHQVADGHRVRSFVILPLCVKITVDVWPLTLKLLKRQKPSLEWSLQAKTNLTS